MATQVNSITATVNGPHFCDHHQCAGHCERQRRPRRRCTALKVRLSSNGQYYAAGMGIGVENTPSGMQSQVIFWLTASLLPTRPGATVTLSVRYPERAGNYQRYGNRRCHYHARAKLAETIQLG